MKARIAALLRRVEVDRAVSFLLLTRIWQALAAPVTLLMIARFYTPQLQGFHYTFLSLIGLQTFVELGMYLVIINVASHEWSKLSLGKDGAIAGDPEAFSRLISLGRLIFRWYSVAALLFVIGAGIAGEWFLRSNEAAAQIEWRAPWWTLVILTGFQLFALALNSLLEGCDQIAAVNQMRFTQAVAGAVAFWLTLALGFGLWAAVVNAAIIFLRDLWLLAVRYRRFFKPFFAPPAAGSVSWRGEIWPLQWRIGAQGLVNYLMYSLFVPVIFHFHGAAEAGRMGMTWQVMTLIQMFGASWLVAKTPRFGMLVAAADYAALDALWLRVTKLCVAVVALGSAAWVAVVAAANATGIAYADRVLSLLPTVLLAAAGVLTAIVSAEAVYLRAHKQEPLVAVGFFSSIIAGICIVFFGRSYGATGAVAAYLAVNAAINLPVVTAIWWTKRREWHGPPLRQMEWRAET